MTDINDISLEETSFSMIVPGKGAARTPGYEVRENFEKAVKSRAHEYSPSPTKLSRPLFDKTNIKPLNFEDSSKKSKLANPVLAAQFLFSSDEQKVNTPVSSPLAKKPRNIHPEEDAEEKTDTKEILKGLENFSPEIKKLPESQQKKDAFKNKPDLSKKPKLPSLDDELDAIREETTEVTEDTELVHKPESRQKSQEQPNSEYGGFRRLITDPAIPYVLSLYLQLFFNIVLVSMIGYLIFSFVSTVRADVENKIESYATEVLQETSLCSREYIRNNCAPGKRVPALEKACMAWERCMNRDPASVGRAKIGAETFAEIINGFVKPISWKSIFTLLLLTVGSLVFTNAAFGSYRNFSADSAYPQQQSQSQPQHQEDHTDQFSPVRSPVRSPMRPQSAMRSNGPTPHRGPTTPMSTSRRSAVRFGNSALRYQDAEKQVSTSPTLSSLAHRNNHRGPY